MNLRKRQRFTRNLCQAIPPPPDSVCDATTSEAISFWLTIKEKISTRLYSQTLPFVSGVLHILFVKQDLPTKVFICCFQKSKRTKFDFWELNVQVQVSAAVVAHSLIKVNLTRKADSSLHTKLGVI